MHSAPVIVRDRPLPAVGRLGVLSALFQLTGVSAGVATLAIGAAIVSPGIGSSSPEKLSVGLLFAASLALGSFRTSRLLEQRRKAGAQLAVLCFLVPVVGFVNHVVPSLISLVVAGSGVALIASVRRYLE